MSPVQHPIIRHLLSSDGRTNCGRPTEGKNITTALDQTTCSLCYYVHKSLKSLKSPEVELVHKLDHKASRTYCGRTFSTYSDDWNNVTCDLCLGIYNIVEESLEVEMSPTFTHRQIAEVFATQVSQISSSAANEVNEYLRAADDDRNQYLFTLRRLVAEMHTLVESIRSVGDLIDNVDAREQFLAKSRYWLLRALRNSVDYTIAEIEANINV